MAAAGLGIAPAAATRHKNAARAGAAAELQQVKPLWSQAVFESYAVCAHPNFMTSTYQHTSTWVEGLASMNAYAFRGMYSPGSAGVEQAIAESRRLGVKWIATVTPESWVSPAEVAAKVDHMAANAADVVIAVEGINEPNHERSGGMPPADWPRRAVEVQRALYESVKSHPELSHVEVISPSLHDAVPTAQADYMRLRAAGVLDYMDVCGLHCYPGARKPDGEGKLDERLGWIRGAYGDVPVWVTETGYHNALEDPEGHQPAPEDVAAVYAPRALLEMAREDVRMVRYELLDDPDQGPDDQQSAFGLWRTPSLAPSSWSPKPEVDVMRDFLASLQDEGAAYTPPAVRLSVESAASDVQWLVTGKRDGSARLWIYRDVSIWDRDSRQRRGAGTTDVVVTSGAGRRTMKVGPEVTSLDL